jgi:hypothetical protein
MKSSSSGHVELRFRMEDEVSWVKGWNDQWILIHVWAEEFSTDRYKIRFRMEDAQVRRMYIATPCVIADRLNMCYSWLSEDSEQLKDFVPEET